MIKEIIVINNYNNSRWFYKIMRQITGNFYANSSQMTNE